MKRKSVIKLFDIAYWGIMLVMIIIELVKNLSNLSIAEFNAGVEIMGWVGIERYIYILSVFVFLVCLCCIVVLAKTFLITVIYFGIKLAYNKYSKEKLDKIDLKNDSYYREILLKYSPGVLSYIDDFNIGEKDVVATIMSLQLKNRIKIKNKIEVINDSKDDLDENEIYILDRIIDEKLKDVNIMIFKSKILNDCKKYKLLEKNKNIKKKIIIKAIKSIFIYFLMIIMFQYFQYIINNFPKEDNFIEALVVLIMILMVILLAIFPFAVVAYLTSYYFMNRLNPYIRNKEAKEINKKLEGLKKYIKDFSILEQRKSEEIKLWEEYLVYSVMFEQNTVIIDEIMAKIKDN